MISLAAILILGIFAQWLAWRIKIPAILPLILFGLIVGPIMSLDLFLGHKLIDPAELLPNQTLHYIVSLSVGIILFEGGLTLKLKEVRHVAGMVRNLILIGPLITMIGTALAAWYLLGMDFRIALIFGSLIIVTGPTVIGPILRSLHANKKVATVLKWESILIDPIGALIAVLMFEFFKSGAGLGFGFTALLTFGKVLMGGILSGGGIAWLFYIVYKKKWVPAYLNNVLALAFVLLAFVLTESFFPESGLLATTLMGIILANLDIDELKNILNFKESLSLLLISMLFIMLAADIEIDQLTLLGQNSFFVFLIVIFLIRPLNVFLSAHKSGLSIREKLFVSWIGPRGIVAAAVASIISISLSGMPNLSVQAQQGIALLIPMTFLIILGTVLIQGLSARPVGKWLGIIQDHPEGILILGADEASRVIAAFLNTIDVEVILVDNAHLHIQKAKKMGLTVLQGNILSDAMAEELEIYEIGSFMAMTSNNELNILACQRMKKELSENNNYRLVTQHEMNINELLSPESTLFNGKTDFHKLMENIRRYPKINTQLLTDIDEYKAILSGSTPDLIPMFLLSSSGNCKIILADNSTQYESGDLLIYSGSPIKHA